MKNLILSFFMVIPLFLSAQGPDLILHNGNVVTMENEAVEKAVAITDGVIAKVGSDAVVLSLATSATKIIDLKGKTVLPGFVEGHSHIIIDRPQDMDFEEVSTLIGSYGYTTVNEMVGYAWFIDQLQQAAADGSLGVRVNVFTNYNYGHLMNGTSMVLEEFYPDHAPILDPNALVRVPGVKVFLDGAFTLERGCWALSEPYRDDFQQSPSFMATGCGPHGTVYVDPVQIRSVVKTIQDKGYRVAFHALGDSAVTIALDAIQFAMGAKNNGEVRHTIHHGGLLRDDQLIRYQDLDIVASVRGIFQTCIQSIYTDRWFSETQVPLLVNRYKVPSLVHAFVEGDYAWTADPEDRSDTRQINPWVNIWALVTHQQLDESGQICTPMPWVDKHQITLQRALEMYTLEGAYAVSMEDHLGSIKEGKFADFMVISENPFALEENQLKDIRPLWTIRGGKTVFCNETSDLDCDFILPVHDPEDVKWKLFPSITNGFIHLSNLPLSPAHLKIIDFNGTHMYQARVDNTQMQLNVATYPAGIYTVILYQGNKVLAKRFIHQ